MVANDTEGMGAEWATAGTASEVDAEERRRVIAQYVHQELGLVDIIAGQIARAVGSHAERDELVAAGREGLFDAARRFDPRRGVPFRAYANIRVQGAIMDWVRRSARLPRRVHEKLRTLEAGSWTGAGASEFVFSRANVDSGPVDKRAVEDAMNDQIAAVAIAMAASIAVEPASSSGEAEATETESDPEEAVSRAELVSVLRGAMTTLDRYEAALVRLIYFEEKSLMEAAKEMSVTKSWVFRLHRQLLTRLNKRVSAAC